MQPVHGSSAATAIMLALGFSCAALATGQDAAPATRPAMTRAAELVPERQRALFDLLGVEEAWQTTRGSPQCLVGVVDTGFDFFHPALRGVMQPGYMADGVYHTPAYEIVAHGTGMASLIIAQPIREEGMTGLAPGCRVIAASLGMPDHTLLRLQRGYLREHPGATMAEIQQEMMRQREKVQEFGPMWLSYVARTSSEAIRDLTDRGAKVISISAYFPRQMLAAVPGAAEQMDDAFAYAIEHDVVIVIGAGNTAARVEEYPGDAESVLVAGASTMEDERWVMEVEAGGQKIVQGSCTGPRLSVLAPAVNLVTARPHDEAFYDLVDSPVGASKVPFEGAYAVEPVGATSSATAIVTSLVALVRSARPDLNAREVVRIVKESAKDLGEPGFDEKTGYGRVDFAAALRQAREIARAP